MKRDIHIEETYPYPPERIWRALTNSDAMADWLMPNTFEPKVGCRFQFRTDATTFHKVGEFTPKRGLR